MTKLNQIIAIESGLKSKTQRQITDLHHLSQKEALLSGISRKYTPKDEEGDRLPSESTLVQVKIDQILAAVAKACSRLYDVTATKEKSNTFASADIVVDGNVLLEDVPVGFLLFLEKQLVDLNTFVTKLPTLDPASEWTWNENVGTWVTPPVQTVRTKKVPRNWVRAEATDKHPAQVDVYNEDVLVGTWEKVDFSGAIPATRKTELLNRIDTLSTAVKFAREAANSAEVVDQVVGVKIFDYLFAE